MNEAEAVQFAMAFVEKHLGKEAYPDSVRFRESGNGCDYWSVVYMPERFFAKEAASGATIDGPYVLHVDDMTGDVKVIG